MIWGAATDGCSNPFCCIHSPGLRQTSIERRPAGVFRGGAGQEFQGFVQSFPSTIINVRAGLQIFVINGEVRDRYFLDEFLLFRGYDRSELFGNRFGDPDLDVKISSTWVSLPERLPPEMGLMLGLDQLGPQAKGFTVFLGAALHDVVYAQLLGDLADGLFPFPILFDRRAGDDPGAP